MKFFNFFITLILIANTVSAQVKILFDATKAETANNADWIIDADNWNLGYTSNSSAYIGGSEANAQRYPTPSQDEIQAGTSENYWTGAISAWAVECVKAGFYVETLPYDGEITYGNSSNPQDLSNYNIFVVCEPNFPFSNSEKTAIINFVANGGGLFMIADHNNSDRDGDGWDSPHVWNDLMNNNSVQNNPFGITFDYENFTDDSQNFPPDASTDPLLSGPYGNVTRVEFYGGTTMSINPNDNSTVKADVYKNDFSNNGYYGVMFAHAEYGQGRVVAAGDSSPFDDGTGDNNDNLYDGWLDDANGNHRVLIMNATMWLAENASGVENIAEKKVFVQNQSGQISLFIPDYQKVKHLQVFNTQGQQILSFDKISADRIRIPLKIHGVYFYKIDFETKQETGKFVY